MLVRFQKEIETAGWKKPFESFKQACHKCFRNVFISENADLKMVQLIYMHPRITNTWQREKIRANTEQVPNQSLCIHVPSGTVVHKFGPKSYSYEHGEHQQFLQDMQYYAKDKQLRIQPTYYGITFTATWFNNEWFLGCRSMIRANECTFGGVSKLYDVFIEALANYGLSEANLDTSRQYTFNLVSNSYAPLTVVPRLYMLDQQNAQVIGEVLSATDCQDMPAVEQFILSNDVQDTYYKNGNLISGYHVEVGTAGEDGSWNCEFVADIDSPFGTLLSEFSKPEIMKSTTLQQFFEKSESEIAIKLRATRDEKIRQTQVVNALAQKINELKLAELSLIEECAAQLKSFPHNACREPETLRASIQQIVQQTSAQQTHIDIAQRLARLE